MSDRRSAGGGLAAVLLMTTLALSCRGGAPRGGESGPSGGAATGWLKGTTEEQVRSVEAQLRGLDVAMVEIGYRFGEAA